MLFLFDTLFTFEHTILAAYFALTYFVDAKNAESQYMVVVTMVSVFLTGLINLYVDSMIVNATNLVNRKPIEQFNFGKQKKNFQLKTWADLQIGDIIKVQANQEIPADALILDIQGGNGSN